MALRSSGSFLVGFLTGSSAALAGYFLSRWPKVEERAVSNKTSSLPPLPLSTAPPRPLHPRPFAEEDPEQGQQLAKMLHCDSLVMRKNKNDDDGADAKAKWNYNWDNRQPESLVAPIRDSDLSLTSLEQRVSQIRFVTPHYTRYIVLVRHGQYEDDHYEDEKMRLTALGREQAVLTGRRLRLLLDKLEEGSPEIKMAPVDLRVVTSTLTRAMETSEIVLQELNRAGLSIENCDLIQEGAPIAPQPPIEDWNPEPQIFHEDGSRIEAGFRYAFNRMDPVASADRVDVLICHGNVIRYFVCRALQLPPDAWLRFNIGHASITVLYIRPSGRVVLDSFGQVGHLPVEKVTF